MIVRMALRAAVSFVRRWLDLCGRSCCVGRSQAALARATRPPERRA